MVRYAQTVYLRDDPEVIRQYEEYHANPFPEIAESWKAQGVERCFIYRYGQQLFMIVEAGDDYDPNGADSLPEAVQERLKEWGVIMDGFQVALPEAPHGRQRKWARMPEIYTYEG